MRTFWAFFQGCCVRTQYNLCMDSQYQLFPGGEEIKSYVSVPPSEKHDDQLCEQRGEQNNELEGRDRPCKPKFWYGRWQQSEDNIYMAFIVENQDLLASESIRRSTKVFEKLSKQLDYKRSADQCRSHHQKMKKMSRYGTTDSILAYIKSKYRKKNLLFQMKREKNPQDKEEEAGPTRADKETVFHLRGHIIRFRNSKKSLMLNIEVDQSLVDSW